MKKWIFSKTCECSDQEMIDQLFGFNICLAVILCKHLKIKFHAKTYDCDQEVFNQVISFFLTHYSAKEKIS